MVWITHVQLLPLNWEAAVGTEPAWAPLPCFGDLLQHREVFANLLNTFVSVSPPHRWCLEGIWFIFLFPFFLCLFHFFQLHLSYSLQTPGEFVVCITGFCLCIYLKATVNTNPEAFYVLSVFQTQLSLKPQSLPASFPAWLGFYSHISPRCDWQSIKPQKLGVERAVGSAVPFPCQGGTYCRCLRRAVPVVGVINLCIFEPQTEPCWFWAHSWAVGAQSAQSFPKLIMGGNVISCDHPCDQPWDELGCSHRAGVLLLVTFRHWLNLLGVRT